MGSLIFWGLIGLILLSLGGMPLWRKKSAAEDATDERSDRDNFGAKNSRRVFLSFIESFWFKTGTRILGIVVIVSTIASTSVIWVPDGGLGTIFRVYGGKSLAPGKIVATDGENGPQARVMAPGFHFELLVNVFNKIDTTQTQMVVPEGHVGILNARDGKPLRPGQAFADPFIGEKRDEMLDAETFLQTGGQRGPQLTVLTPGTYRLNPYLWEIKLVEAYEVHTGFVGVVKSNVYADVDFGTMKSLRPESCAATKPNEAGNNRIEALLVPVGCVGVWAQSLQPGKYYLNPDAFAITPINTQAQVWTYAGGYTKRSIALTVDATGEIQQTETTEVRKTLDTDADEAVFVKMEGWDVPLELRVVAQVSPENAACVVAGVGTMQEVEDRVLTPSIRAITRDVAGGTYKVDEPKVDINGQPILNAEGQPEMVSVNRPTRVLDLINQRPLIEGEIEMRIRPEGEKACVDIREVRLGEPAIPPEVLIAPRRKQLATQMADAFIQEKLSQDQRVAAEKSKATANQQATLVTAEIGVQASEQNAEAARNQGIGERDKLLAIAEGQKAQTEVLGVDATVQLRQYELIVGKAFDFITVHPEVLTAALSNAQKFVPNIMVGGDGGSGGMMAALFGKSLESGIPLNLTPTSPVTGN